MTERVLCVAAHPDDETLGCGATLAKHLSAGDQVSVVVIADGVSSRGAGLMGVIQTARERHAMCRAACKILGTEDVWLHQFPDNRLDHVDALEIVKQIETHIGRFKPTVVYTHHGSDLNIDHRIVSDSVMVACRPMPEQTVRRVLMFEVPSSTEWSVLREPFRPNWFEAVTMEQMQKKLQAFGCYSTEVRDLPHPRGALMHLAAWRGANVGTLVAEAFMLARRVA